ncbi:preATP grasp domain-containing protein [Caldibacillus thermoamylovorans]
MKMIPVQKTPKKLSSLTQKIVVGNVDGESLVGEPEKHTPEMKILASIIANRLTWLAKENDILLMPYPISKNFLNYVQRLMNVELDSVKCLTPARDSFEAKLLTYETLANSDLQNELRKLMKMNSEAKWVVEPYFFDRAVANLARSLNIEMKEHKLDFFLQGGAELLNSKAEFRRIASAYNIPIAEGVNCYSVHELKRALHQYIKKTGSVIVKQDINAGGDGNIVITFDDREQSLGAIQTFNIKQKSELDDLAIQIWNRQIGTRNRVIVVETYYETKSVFYSELEIREGHLRPYLLNFGDMRMEPVWNGFIIPTKSLKEYALSEFVSCSMQLAEIARKRGYIGKINCDGILTTDGRVLITEINGRLGGCTHIHVVAEKLYGTNYGDHYCILTRNKIKVGYSFVELLEVLDKAGLLVKQAHQEGVIILTEDTERSKTIEYMIVGSSYQKAIELEKRAEKIFEGSCQG